METELDLVRFPPEASLETFLVEWKPEPDVMDSVRGDALKPS